MNILIVDDEANIRRWFELLVGQTSLAIQVAGTCGNGREALELCRSIKVDLVITDIKMPIMDGLELVQQLKAEQPSVRTLILSSYGEFQYASKALKLGASDYVLKAEVTVEGLREALQKIEADLQLELKREQEVHTIKTALNENLYALRTLYFQDLFKGSPSALSEFKGKMEVFRVPLSDRHLTVLAVKVNNYKQILQSGKIRSKELLDLAVINIMDETMHNEAGGGCCFLQDTNVYAVLFNVSSPQAEKSTREATMRYANRIIAHLGDYLNISASVGISMTYPDLSKLGQQWKEAYGALSGRQFYGKQHIAWYQDMHRVSLNADTAERTELIAALTRLLELGEIELARERLTAFMDDIGVRQLWSEQQVRSLCLEVAYLLLRVEGQYDDGLAQREQGKSQQEAEAPHEEVAELSEWGEVKQWLLDRVDRLALKVRASRTHYSEAIRKACGYMRDYYADDLSLQQVADAVHLNKTYLSELFKKETGTSFSDHLTELRIERAKELIVREVCKMSDLAERVGYPNSSYFTKVFKKTTGLTPMEYRQMMSPKIKG
ncbi:response regulator [Paenibacillus sp. UNC451MF]|uniref:response regulator n=1 Tax=Paenibacillus sp. UNC451MF TaxID=1449063 RepID=UPI00048F53C0|nr:response regulator [Paenibacillus sp. UNC451MF]